MKLLLSCEMRIPTLQFRFFFQPSLDYWIAFFCLCYIWGLTINSPRRLSIPYTPTMPFFFFINSLRVYLFWNVSLPSAIFHSISLRFPFHVPVCFIWIFSVASYSFPMQFSHWVMPFPFLLPCGSFSIQCPNHMT